MSARGDLIRCFERHASSAVSEEVADVILAKHAQELAAKIRATVEQSTAYRPKWEAGMQDAAKLIEEG